MSGRHGPQLPDGQSGIAALRRSSVGAPAIVVLTLLGAPVTARAFDKATCVDSHESAQKSMKAGRVRETKEQLLTCADSSCPALVRDDCEKWLSNLDRQPQPVTTGETAAEPGSESGPSNAGGSSDRATGEREESDHSYEHSRDRSNVANAANVAHPEDLRSEPPQDPGSPVAGDAPTTSQTPATPAAGATQGHDAALPGDDLGQVTTAAPRHPIPTAAWVTGILALASFGTAASFGVTGWLDARSLRETCAPNCASARVSTVRQNLLIADVSALTGLAFSAVAAWMIWSHGNAGAPEGSKPDAAKLSASLTGHSFRLDYVASF